MPNPGEDRRNRVLLLTPVGRDSYLISEALAAEGVKTEACSDVRELANSIHTGAGAVLIAEEALTFESFSILNDVFENQPPWSDLPVIVLSIAGESTPGTLQRLAQIAPFGNVTLIERPVRPATLITVVQTALRARARQYEVERLLRQLAEQAKALQQSNGDLQRFAYAASHDLQEPLRTISSFSQLLARKNGSSLDPDSQQFVTFILEGVERMRALIRDLLDFSKFTADQEHPAGPVDCNAILGLALQHLQFKLAETGATVTFDPLPVVRGHESLLLQVFQNIIGNALKYSNGKPAIYVSARRENGDWRIAIRDNGIGIPPEHHERVFGLFQRLHNGREYPGTGIGLATCKRIVERSGGRIWVESERGSGSTFYFTLPAVEAAQSSGRVTAQAPLQSSTSSRF